MVSRPHAALLVALAALFATSCQTDPSYRPALRAGESGWRIIPIETGRYRVSFKGRTSEDEAVALALRRAGEFALEHGYEWITLVGAKAYTQKVPVRRLAEADPSLNWPSVQAPAAGRSVTEAVVEVQFVKGTPPAGADARRPTDLIEGKGWR